VYAARAQTENNDIFPAAVHVGPTPTFAGNSFTVEAHLIHFSGNLYHQALRLEFLHRLRDIRPFRDSLELTSQLKLDVQKVQKLTNNNGTK
ncbi:MAG: riboflavin kinase, partial [Gemmataceae bacterium]